jgi:hypothetical protein
VQIVATFSVSWCHHIRNTQANSLKNWVLNFRTTFPICHHPFHFNLLTMECEAFMPIRKSPVHTRALLAANRANALKSTGPRTPCGKARVSLNALKHGRSIGPAGRAPRFRERLPRAGYRQQEAVQGDLRSCLAQPFGARSPHWRRQLDQFAASAWCVVMGRSLFRTKPECTLDSRAEGSRFLSQNAPKLARSLRYRAEDPWRRIGVALWLQRRR